MRHDDTIRTIRVLALLRGVFSLYLLLRPRIVLRELGRADLAARGFARVLGFRQLTEAAVLLAHPTARLSILGAVVDAIHAVTALGLAWLARGRHSRELLANALSAGALSAAGAFASRRTSPPRSTP